MSDVKSSDAISRGGDSSDPTRYNAKMREIQQIDKLAESSWQMTDLRDEEIIVFSIYQSLDLGLRFKDNGKEVGGLPQFRTLIESIRDMRPSRNRQSRREFIEGMGKGRSVMPWEMPPGFKQDEEQDRPKWWQFWRRR